MKNPEIQCSYCPNKGCFSGDMSKAPVTVLAVKDRVLAHNPLGALYTARHIYTRLNTKRPKKENPTEG